MQIVQDDYQIQILFIIIFLIDFGVHMNILFIVKAMFDFLIQWSSRYLQICFFIAFIMFDLIHVCSSSMYFLIHASLWCLLLYLHLTTHLSKYRYPLR